MRNRTKCSRVFNSILAITLVLTLMPGGGIVSFADELDQNPTLQETANLSETPDGNDVLGDSSPSLPDVQGQNDESDGIDDAVPALAAADPQAGDSDPLRAPGDTGEIIIDFKDLDGNMLPNSALGSGATLYYYKLPLSTYNELLASQDGAYIATELAKYEKTFTPNQASTTYSVGNDMDPRASADEPYILAFYGGSRIEASPDLASEFVTGNVQRTPSKWLAYFAVIYDGSTLRDYGNTTTADSSDMLHGTVFLDDTLVNPHAGIAFDASAYAAAAGDGAAPAYPLYARVLFMGTSAVPMSDEMTSPEASHADAPPVSSDAFAVTEYSQSVIVPVNADGTINVNMPQSLSGISPSGINRTNTIAISLYADAECTQPLTDWYHATEADYPSTSFGDDAQFSFMAQMQSDGSIWFLAQADSQASAFNPVFQKRAADYDPAPITLTTDSNNPSVDYPRFINVELKGRADDGDTVLANQVVEVTANGSYPVDFPIIASSGYDSYKLTAEIFMDEGCTQPDHVWHSGFENEVLLGEDGKLIDSWDEETVIDTMEISHEWMQLQPLTVKATTNTPEEYPAYVRVRLAGRYYFDEDGTYTVIADQKLTFNANGEQTIELPMVDYSILHDLTLSYAIFSNEACTMPLNQWYGANSKVVYVEYEDGSLIDDDEKNANSIEFTHISATELTVPMTVDFGSRAAADFFPTTVEITLSGDPRSSIGVEGLTPVTVTKTFTSLEDFENSRLASFTLTAADGEVFRAVPIGYVLDWNFYTDESKAAKDSRWSSGSIYCGITNNGQLVARPNSPSYTDEDPVLGLNFRPLEVSVAPDAVESEMTHDNQYPLHVFVVVQNDFTGEYLSWQGERTNVAPFTAEIDRMSYGFANPGMGERWNIAAFVTDADYYSLAEGWTPDPNGSSRYVAYQTIDGNLQYNEASPFYHRPNNASFAGIVLRPSYTPASVNAAVDIHVNVPEGVENPYLWGQAAVGSDPARYNDAVHLRLFKNGANGYEQVWADDGQNLYGYSYHYANVNNLDANSMVKDFPLGSLVPGTYYLTWFMGNCTAYDGADPAWVRQDDPVEIIVTDDGKVTDKNGMPFTVEVYYKDDYKKPLIQPNITVNIDWPEQYLAESYKGTSAYIEKADGSTGIYYFEDIYNPDSFQLTMTPAWENADSDFSVNRSFAFRSTGSGGRPDTYYRRAIAREGANTLGSYVDWANNMVWWGSKSDTYYATYYNDTPLTESNYVFGYLYSHALSYDSAYSWPERHDDWYLPWGQVNWYNRELFVGYPSGYYTVSYSVNKYENSWHSDSATVFLGADGKLYTDESCTQEYTIEIYMVDEEEIPADETFDKLTLSVNTIVHDGISAEKAFKEGEFYWVGLVEGQSYSPDAPIIASGQATITETGVITIDMFDPDGKPIGLHDNTSYTLFGGMISGFDEQGNPIFANDWRPENYGFTDYMGYHILDSLDENGVFRAWYPNSETYVEGDPLVLPNECTLLPWDPVAPKSVTQSASESAVTFNLMTSYTQLQDKYHYIVVVQNQYDNKWYALAYDENGGHQIELADVTSLQDLKDGYEILESDADGSMILTANKTKQAEDSAELQLKTGAKDSEGKAISVKMGTSSTVLDPLFSTSAGTIIVRNMQSDDPEAPTFQIWKGGYAELGYTHEMFGKSGFGVLGAKKNSNTGAYEYSNYMSYTNSQMGPDGSRYGRIWGGPMDGAIIRYSDDRGVFVDEMPYPGYYRYDMPEQYLTGEYRASFDAFWGTMQNQAVPCGLNFYILTDCQEEEPAVENNTYTRVKTFGDFNNTFVEEGGTSATMVLIYTDDEGKQWALNPKGLVKVQTQAGSSGYDKVITGAENELIPNNNSGTSETFNFSRIDVAGTGEQVFANDFSFRKSRQNNYEDGQYLTLDGKAWNNSDDVHQNQLPHDGLVYVLSPTDNVYSQADWDTVTSYKLRVIRNGETAWLGVENGQMVVVSSEDEAIAFDVYAPKVTRYYSSAYGSDLYQYYRVYSPEDINEGDEILIAYNDNGTRRLVAWTNAEKTAQQTNPYSFPGIEVLDSYSEISLRDAALPEGTRYKYRLDTEDTMKKPYAYFDEANGDLIYAQGVSSNAIGTAKKETSSQRKYESVVPLGNQQYFLYIKADKYGYVPYVTRTSEVNFFRGSADGYFTLRGGKEGAYLTVSSYTTQKLDVSTGRYVAGDPVMTFATTNTTTPDEFEVYKKASTTETFTVEYYDEGMELAKKEIRPQEPLTLRQNDDLKKDDTSYVFVGWTADPTKAGLLPLEDSANLYDYNDLSKVASVTDEAKEAYGLLGNCNPDASNIVSYDTLKPFVNGDGVLKLYPVYAVRGFSSYVTGDEGDIHVIGITDVKDLQMGGDGNPEAAERWLGSINVKIYKDGALWVSETNKDQSPDGTSGTSSTSGASANAFGKMSVNRGVYTLAKLGDPAETGNSATMYFAYHNDDAADLNIKFIEDVVEAELADYLSNDDFSAFEPTEKYVIDAVYAEQGGSEDGLKYRYNWMDKEHGGQLDNVKGGSTVEVYVTTKYQVKYYFDAEGDGTYKELPNVPDGMNTDEGYTNPNFYTTPGTEIAVNERLGIADYVVMSDNEYSDLMERTPSLTTTFRDEPISRGEYQKFVYKFDDYEHVIPIMPLPTPPDGFELDSDAWTIHPEAGVDGVELVRGAEEPPTVAPSSDYPVTETTYGTGNSKWAYKDADKLGDTTMTYHLYIAVQNEEEVTYGDISFTKAWEDDDDADGIRPTAEEFAAKLQLLADGEQVSYEPEVTDNDDNTFTITYIGIPLTNADGEDIVYTLKEGAIEGYEAVGSDEVGVDGTLTNKHEPEPGPEPELIDITVTKTWSDSNDADGKRPASITVNLLANGEKIDSHTITAAEQWTYTFTELPATVDGKDIVYTVAEDKVTDYETAIAGSADEGFTITNTYTPTEPEPEPEPPAPEPEPVIPSTGDGTPVGALLGMGGLAAMLAAVAFLRMRRRDE